MPRYPVPILATLLAATLAQAGEPAPAPPRTITVTGRAVGYVPADTVLWTVTLDSTGKDVSEVKKVSDQQVKSLTDACKQKGIQPDDIDAGLIRIQDVRMAEGKASGDAQRPFTATRSVTIRQRDLLRFNDVLEMLGREKGTRIRYVFVCLKRDAVIRDTIIQAAQAAREKADAMAKVVGSQLGKALAVNEYAPPELKIADASVPIDKESAAFGADAEKIIMTVYVTFELQ